MPRKAFTLVELLVVVAIIALLLGILLPTLSKARSSAKVLRCGTNLKQIGSAWQAYFLDSNGKFPPLKKRNSSGSYSTQNTQWYYGGLHPSKSMENEYRVATIKDDRPLNPYVGADLQNSPKVEIFRCPDDRSVESRTTGYQLTEGYTLYEYNGNCYMANYFLLWDDDNNTEYQLTKVTASPGSVMLAGEAYWYYLINTIVNEIDDPDTALYDADFHGTGFSQNVLFLDGHVSFEDLRDTFDVPGAVTGDRSEIPEVE